MTDLNALTSKVLEEKKAALQEEINQVEQAVNEEVGAFEAEASERFEAEKKSAKEQIDREKEIQHNSINIQERNKILGMKQEYITRVLDGVIQKMNEADDELVKGFIERTLPQFEGFGHMRLVLGEHNQQAITDQWLGQLDIPGLDVALAEDSVTDEAGFILEQEGIEYNFLFSELLKAHRSKYVAEINQKLF